MHTVHCVYSNTSVLVSMGLCAISKQQDLCFNKLHGTVYVVGLGNLIVVIKIIWVFNDIRMHYSNKP